MVTKIIDGKNEIKITLEHEHGDLPYLIFYQSLNGLPCFEHIRTIDEVKKRLLQLMILNRNPQLFIYIKDFDISNLKEEK